MPRMQMPMKGRGPVDRPMRGGPAVPPFPVNPNPPAMKKGGMTASKRADGIAQRGKTRGTIVMCGGGMYKK